MLPQESWTVCYIAAAAEGASACRGCSREFFMSSVRLAPVGCHDYRRHTCPSPIASHDNSSSQASARNTSAFLSVRRHIVVGLASETKHRESACFDKTATNKLGVKCISSVTWCVQMQLMIPNVVLPRTKRGDVETEHSSVMTRR